MTVELGSELLKGESIKTLFQEELIRCAKMEQKKQKVQRHWGVGLSWSVLLIAEFSL